MLREYIAVVSVLSLLICLFLSFSNHNTSDASHVGHPGTDIVVNIVTHPQQGEESTPAATPHPRPVSGGSEVVSTEENSIQLDLDKVRWGSVSCVGDSITEGARTKREIDTYPGQLQAFLKKIAGKAYRVSNKGKQGLCAAYTCDNPYYKTAFWRSLTGKQNAAIVVFMLGHNDAKDYNWVNTGPEVFKRDYLDMIRTVQKFPSNPKIFIGIPPPMYAPSGFGINQTIVNTIMPGLIREIAAQADITIIDVYNEVYGGLPLKRSSQESLMSIDGVHPNPTGYHEIGRFIGESIIGQRLKSPSPTTSPVSHLINPYSSHMRIAALGDDSTGGSGIKHFTKQFPYRLFLALDQAQHNTFSVDFVGEESVLLTKEKKESIWGSEKIWTEMKELRPNMVLVILGREDCRDEHWKGEAAFKQLYNELVAKIVLEANPSFKPMVVAVIPTPVLGTGWGINLNCVNTILPRLIREIAASNNDIAATFDLFTLFGGANRQSHSYVQRDGIHPTREGAKAMAQYVRDEIMILTKLWETRSPVTANYSVPLS